MPMVLTPFDNLPPTSWESIAWSRKPQRVQNRLSEQLLPSGSDDEIMCLESKDPKSSGFGESVTHPAFLSGQQHGYGSKVKTCLQRERERGQ